MKSFFRGMPAPSLSSPGPVPADIIPRESRPHAQAPAAEAILSTTRLSSLLSEARIAVYDSLTAAPRVEIVSDSDADAFIEVLSARVFGLSKEMGGAVPFTVIRELAENFVHAGFAEPVVTVLDSGNTIRFSDQGPGIPDKERVFMPGFSTASSEMKRVIKGVGSGLPIARECLQFAGGSIQVEDNLGRGTVVTVAVSSPSVQEESVAEQANAALPRLTLRQKQVLSLAVEFGSVGPTVVAKELEVGLSTAYRDLASLEELGLLAADESGKRGLTQFGISSLDRLLGT